MTDKQEVLLVSIRNAHQRHLISEQRWNELTIRDKYDPDNTFLEFPKIKR